MFRVNINRDNYHSQDDLWINCRVIMINVSGIILTALDILLDCK